MLFVERKLRALDIHFFKKVAPESFQVQVAEFYVPPDDGIAGENDYAWDRKCNTIVKLMTKSIWVQLNIITFAASTVEAKGTHILGENISFGFLLLYRQYIYVKISPLRKLVKQYL